MADQKEPQWLSPPFWTVPASPYHGRPIVEWGSPEAQQSLVEQLVSSGEYVLHYNKPEPENLALRAQDAVAGMTLDGPFCDELCDALDAVDSMNKAAKRGDKEFARDYAEEAKAAIDAAFARLLGSEP